MKPQLAIEHFKTLNCAQSVLLTQAEDLNLDKTTALRIALGFGGGACMVLGMKVDTEGKTLQEIKAEAKASVRKFNELFIARHGSLSCKKLLGVDLSTPEGAAEASEKQLFDTICPGLVASATEILEENF
jgi:C_GCAxxG_C_C family probable redox protein